MIKPFQKWCSDYQFQEHAKAVNHHYWDESTIRYFGAKLHRRHIADSGLWAISLESVQYKDARTGRKEARVYKVRVIDCHYNEFLEVVSIDRQMTSKDK